MCGLIIILFLLTLSRINSVERRILNRMALNFDSTESQIALLVGKVSEVKALNLQQLAEIQALRDQL